MNIKNCIGQTFDCLMLSKQAKLTSIHLFDSLIHSIDKYHPYLDLLLLGKPSFSDHFESPCIIHFKTCNFAISF